MTFRRRVRLNPGQVRDLRGGGGLALGGGIGGVVLVVAFLLLGLSPNDIPLDALNGITVGTGQNNSDIEQECQTGEDANQRQDCRMIGFVNAIQDYWGRTMDGYTEIPTTFFTGQVGTGCGTATSAVGPFYCPEDTNVYIDLDFFNQLEGELGAEGGPLAEAYVLAHEYGHHVQDLLGVLRGGTGATGAESRSVRTELQADCYAGVFLKHAEERYLEPISQEQLEQARDAAASVGDDRIQERTQGQVDPETWTHGSSEQRQRWLRTGWQSGDPNQCDTFSTNNL
jgi:predicted metalloprotease